ncbi:hypothetical protein HD842_001063 [Massilia aurea]|uniref:Uncharacterized protein n=1 Tax=Massilia aurea TaxID=373040 RepID=A0A7W9WY22_9BURK|nr:hypothetical protein [Massilia aurea]MBB6132952.1 hypothetical protein [Massilia aurea]
MTDATPDARCTLSPQGTLTTVRVGSKCKVSYKFDTRATSAALVVPYVVSIDGQVLPEYADKPGALRGQRTIDLLVNPGSKVALFLNSDVHPSHRSNPVYALEVGRDDVQVNIVEKKGRIGHELATLRAPVCRPGATPGKRLQVYDAALTGDIWMQISHLYTSAEADALLPADTAPAIRAAVRSIYAGLARPEVSVKFAASDTGPALTRRVVFRDEMQGNVLENTTHCPWLTGILPRTHPCAFAALLTEAHAAGVTSVAVTSGWRPSLGSIAHRAGLGLDITYLEGGGQTVFLNRASLTNGSAAGNGNVSAREKVLWREHQDAKAERATRERERGEMRDRLARNRESGNPAQLVSELADANVRLVAARDRENIAREEWDRERNLHEPVLICKLRDRLVRNASVKQLFDPWYMDADTTDQIAPVANEQRRTNPNERLHNNHLHITVREPKIL